MSCDIDEATEGSAELHSPTLASLHLRHSSFSNPSVASPTSQLILQTFRCFCYVTGTSPTSPGEPPMPRTTFLLLRHFCPLESVLYLCHFSPLESVSLVFFAINTFFISTIVISRYKMNRGSSSLSDDLSKAKSKYYVYRVFGNFHYTLLRPGAHQSSKAAFCKSAFAKSKLTFGKSDFARSRFVFRQSIFASQKVMVWPSPTSKLLSAKTC